MFSLLSVKVTREDRALLNPEHLSFFYLYLDNLTVVVYTLNRNKTAICEKAYIRLSFPLKYCLHIEIFPAKNVGSYQ